jgi:kynurenine formamidase
LAASAAIALCCPGAGQAVEPAALLALSSKSPAPPWPAGDELGMANTLGEATTLRCGWHLSQRGARIYEASFVRTNTMPKSPFANPSLSKPKPTAGVPFSAHAFNSEAFDAGAEPQQQGTQIDALGHFASIAAPWDPKNPYSADGASYYGGYKQADIKPTADSPLLKLGIEKIPALVTTAVLLDAKSHVGKGKPMAAGEVVTAAHIEGMLKAQGLAKRGILPGDMVWIHTGWSEHWKEGEAGAPYYAGAPGLAVDAAKLLSTKRIVAIGLDAPFIDAVPEGMLQGKAAPAQGTEPGLPFSIHHYMLSVFGIHHLENLNLGAMARDRVWTSCAMALPSRDQGAAGAVVRPVAIGLPGQR